MRESQHLKDLDTLLTVHAHEFMKEEHINPLDIITLVKLKICEKSEARSCVNGMKQLVYMDNANVSSCTTQLESIILSIMIDVKEGWDIDTADVVSAY